MKSAELLEKLTRDTISDTNFVKENLANVKDEHFFSGPGGKEWSSAEILQHLNLTNKFYITELRKLLETSSTELDPESAFKSGVLGGYFVKMLKPLPDDGMRRKLRAPKKLTPEYSSLIKENVLNDFFENQKSLLGLIEKSKNVDLMKNKVPSSVTRLIKLNWGDTLSIIVFHNRRHIIQIKKILNKSNQD